MKKILSVCLLLTLTAPAISDDCKIKQAADLAVQRQVTLIDAAKVNPSDFFSGKDSCVSPDILKSYDLSKLIPDLSGLLTSAAESTIKNLINKAKQKVCDKINDELKQVINKINSQLGSFESSLDSDLSKLVNGSFSSISMPNVSGVGQYTVNEIDKDALEAVDIPQPQVLQQSSILNGNGTSSQFSLQNEVEQEAEPNRNIDLEGLFK